MHLLSQLQFESLCRSIFQSMGYVVRAAPASDRLVHLEMVRDGRLVLVRCKQLESTHSAIGELEVREFADVVAGRGADAGIFCTNGYFSTNAGDYAHEAPIELVDGAEITRLWSTNTRGVSLPAVPKPREWS